jgi:CheY-specific phosphatase CheX
LRSKKHQEALEMNADSLARIDGFLSSAVRELFAAHGLSLSEVEYRGQGVEVPFASTIGFTSSKIVGVLVLTASRDLVALSLPENLKKGKISDEMIADWTGELSNQALGRLKNRFYAAGIDIALSTPAVFAGKELRHFFQPSIVYRSIMFGGAGALLAEFQANCESGLEIEEERPTEEPAPPEGEALFF